MNPEGYGKHDPSTDDKLCGFYGHRNKRGGLCGAFVIKGTQHCGGHAGVTLAKAKAKGAVVTELREWGLTGHRELVDPGEILLRLVTQSAARCEMYARYLAEAVAAADRLQRAGVAPQSDLLEAETARLDLERIFNHGPVAALIGHTYAGSPTNGVIATGEKIRGLTQLEAEERDRCANFAARATTAGLAERMVRASEQLAGQMATAVERVLVRRGLAADSAEVRAEVAAELLALAGGPKTIEGAVAA